jgi:hypothetical protein
MNENKNIYRGLSIKEYMKKRYIIHNEITVDCRFCKKEYKLSVIRNHLIECKRCIKIREEYEKYDKLKFMEDKIKFNNEISILKKNSLEKYYEK